MQEYGNWYIEELPLSAPSLRVQAESFLGENGLSLDSLDAWYALRDSQSGIILAGAGREGRLIKCVAVCEESRGEGLLEPLISRVMSDAGAGSFRVFTKPSYRPLFESLGFKLIAEAPLAVFMSLGTDFPSYISRLKEISSHYSGKKAGAVVINANPLTLGHKYLLERAASCVDVLYVLLVEDDSQRFSFREREAMVSSVLPPGAVLLPSSYSITREIFPTYFIKELSEAAQTQMRLDIGLFFSWIVPALGLSLRFVGTEPSDELTARYNSLLKEFLQIEVVEVPRMGNISASLVRKYLDEGNLSAALELVPSRCRPWLLGDIAALSLQTELDAPLKPGLVCPESRGAHSDMDYAVMRRSIRAIRPYFALMAKAGDSQELKRLGIQAEEAMLSSSGGINTHRGAVFALGLALNAALSGDISAKIAELAGEIVPRELYGAGGARKMALGGYRDLFKIWLPFYRSLEGDAMRLQKTLLKIMSSLEDTCILRRKGHRRAMKVRGEAAELLESNDFKEGLSLLCSRYEAEGISPGGAADMLSLTVFMDIITKANI